MFIPETCLLNIQSYLMEQIELFPVTSARWHMSEREFNKNPLTMAVMLWLADFL